MARDLGDTALIAGRITRVLWTVAIVGIILSIASGLLAAAQAARRAEFGRHRARGDGRRSQAPRAHTRRRR
ncbi:MAG: hypothetical protein NVV62_19660 [Terricaulis sp.]|nr:hypothetical protein [Terricaulis sp.]